MKSMFDTLKVERDGQVVYGIKGLPEISGVTKAGDPPQEYPRAIVKTRASGEFGAAWSGTGEVRVPPRIGSEVRVHMNDLGIGRIVAYAVQFGFFGVEVVLLERPEWHTEQEPNNPNVIVFGAELDPTHIRHYARYAWVIDKDILEPVAKEGVYSGPNVYGPRTIDPVLEAKLKAGDGECFMMYDDDDELYYEGRIVGEYSGFEPLEDYGTPNAGATRIDYLENGVWKTL